MMIGFVMGGSCHLHSPTYPSLFPLSSSSSQPIFFYSCQRNALHYRKAPTISASLQRHDPEEDASCQRRAILFLGFSALPFLNSKARAAQNLAPDQLENSARTEELNQIAETTTEKDASPNPFLTLSSGLGILASGVLGAFYALAQKEKSADMATIESMKTKLAEKEAAIVSMQKSFESKLEKEKLDKNEQIKKSNQEKQNLMSQISSANGTITGLGKELQKEKKIIENLNIQIDSLTADLTKASNHKEDLEAQLKQKVNSIEVLQERVSLLNYEIKDKEDSLANLKSALSAKESELKKLSSVYEQTLVELTGSKSEIEELKQEIFKFEKELGLKISTIDDMNAQISSLRDENNNVSRQLESFRKELTELKLSSEERAASDAKKLEERAKELKELKDQLETALTEAKQSKVLISDLTKERDALREALDVEISNVKSLEEELRVIQETVTDTRNKAAEVENHLRLSQSTCKELEAEVLKVKAEASEAKEASQKNLDKLKQTAETVAGELLSRNDVLEKTKEELNRVSLELAETSENHDSLRKELVETYKNVENVGAELKEEKKTVAALTKEVKALESQISNDRESRKSLETDLEEATRSLDEMNRNVLMLSSELESSKSKISGLEDEKEALYKTLEEQKQIVQEAQENMEDAHSIVIKLGKERDSLEKRGNKLEKELAAAKGEILRLRTEKESTKTAEKVNDSGSEDENAAASVRVKKVGRRKKVASPQKES